MTAASKLRSPSPNSLYLKRRSQRDNALRKVIRLSYALQHTQYFFNNLEAWRSATGGHFVPDHFMDLIADTLQGEESQLDVAVDRLSLANRRLHEVRDAMDSKPYSVQLPESVVKAPGDKDDLAQVARNMFRCVD